MKKLLVLSFVSITVSVFATEEAEKKADGASLVTKATSLENSDDGESILSFLVQSEASGTSTSLLQELPPEQQQQALDVLVRSVVFPPLTGSEAGAESEGLKPTTSYWSYLSGLRVPYVTEGFTNLTSYISTYRQGTPTPSAEGNTASVAGRDCIVGVSSEQVASDKAEVEEFLNMAKAAASIEDVPVDIFFKDLALMLYVGVVTKYKLTSLAGGIASVINIVNPLRLYSPLAMITGPALTGFANNVAQGDMENFPEISLDYIVGLLKDIPNRKTFAKLPLFKRAFPFQTKGKTLVGKGYNGYAIIKDIAYGRRLVLPNEEPTAIAKAEKTVGSPLNTLVAFEESGTASEWIEERFILPSPMELRKISGTFDKDEYGNTWGIYECFAHPETLMVMVMREKKEKFDTRVKLWQNAWQHTHADTSAAPAK